LPALEGLIFEGRGESLEEAEASEPVKEAAVFPG